MDVSVAEAVKEFNQRAQQDPVGKTQPPLTEDELVAAIRGWIPDEHPGCGPFLASFKKVAATGVLPVGIYLNFVPGWKGYNGYDYCVWWIDLFVPGTPEQQAQHHWGYNFRLRAQMISSRPHQHTAEDEREQEFMREALKHLNDAK